MRISVGKVFWHHKKNYISKGTNVIGSVPSLACICRHFRSRFTTAFGPTGTCVTHRVSYESSNHNRSQSLVETGDAFFLHLKKKELSSRLCSETTLSWICWWARIITFECIRFGGWARSGLRRERGWWWRGIERRGWKPKRNWSSCSQYTRPKKVKPFATRTAVDRAIDLDRMSKEGLEISQPVYTGTLYLQRAEKYLPLYLDKKKPWQKKTLPLKPHRKFDDSLGKMNYKLRLTNFLRASLVPLGYVPSGAGEKKQGIQY